MVRFEEQRQKMVDEQIAARGIQDLRVLEAMKAVPRERFVNQSEESLAYEDTPLPIEAGQTISQPYMVAWMAQEAELKPQDRILEIGTGSGYSTAVLSQLAAHVYSIEWHSELADLAKTRLEQLGYRNTTLSVGDGTLGWSKFAPFDAIIVTAGGPQVPLTLLKQLKVGGRLVIPIGSDLETQQLTKVVKKDEKTYLTTELGSVRFVPLVGQEGWKNSEKHPSL